MRKLNQTGFSAVEGLLSLIVVVLIVFVGYYVYHTQKNSNDALNSATTTANQTVSGHSSAKMTSGQAVVFVQNTYNDYLSAVNQALTNNSKDSKDAQPVEIPGLAAVKKDFSTDFYNQVAPAKAGQDNVGCALYQVDSYKAHLVQADQGGSAVVGVDINSGGSINGTITVTVNLTTRKITQITCPA